MTAAIANTYETLCSLADCKLVLNRRQREILLSWGGQKSSHFDSCIALAVAQGLVAATRSKEPGMIVQIPRFNARKPMAPVEYFTRIWVNSDTHIFLQTQGPHNGPVYSFDVWETITLVQGLISGVRALQGWRLPNRRIEKNLERTEQPQQRPTVKAMNPTNQVLTDEERAVFVAAKAVIDKLLGQPEKAAPEIQSAPAKYLSIPAYAQLRNVSEATVRSWIKKGLPVTVTRPVRVNVPAANLWVDGGPIRLRLITNVVQSKDDKSEP